MLNNTKSHHIPLRFYNPQWGSKLANTIIELEKLREKKIGGPVPPAIFFQIKNIFQKLESLGSARIEGNNTTLAEFVEKVIEKPTSGTPDEKMQEIQNIEHAIEFIENTIDKTAPFNRGLISDIHKILVEGLTPPPRGEGSRYPGTLRPINVTIKRSSHIPPEALQVPEYIDEVMNFVNQPLETQYHLLAIAISHHRLAWIHPFDNGNGRLVRMFTYAFLIKQGFQVKSGRILNPTAIFCMDRNKYYEKLTLADSGQEEKVLDWCLYVLEGLRVEIEKIDRLLDLNYIVRTILLPTLSYALKNQHITEREYTILARIVNSPGMSIKSADLEAIIGQESVVQRSRILKKLKDKGMIISLKEKGRIYTMGFSNNYLLRGVIQALRENNFIPESLNNN